MATDTKSRPEDMLGDINKYDFRNDEHFVFKARKGLDRKIVEEISEMKGEPRWMRDFRLKSLDVFNSKPMPLWGGRIGINFQDVFYYLKPTDGQSKSWEDVPADIKNTFDKLGIPDAEKKFLSGVKAQYESEVVYGSLREDLAKQGVIFTDTDSAVREHPDLLREYFSTIIPPTDNKFAALNSAVWSGGSFIYVPKGLKIEFPLQAYFRINAANMGQFERTLIIVDEGAQVHYVEGCTAPMYSTESLHSAVVEVIAKRGSRVRYTTIQNWANNIYNLVTKRAMAYGDSLVEWVDGNLGSRLTMKYPAIYMMEPGARGEVLSVAFASAGQHQDAGAKVVHCAPHTSSRIVSKSISKNGGRASYRGLCKVMPGAKKSKSNVVCDALILDPQSRSDTYPYLEIEEQDVTIGHEASVSRIDEEQLFYLASRGLSEAEASTMIVSGFIEPLVKELPMEYALEMNRLIELQMEGTVWASMTETISTGLTEEAFEAFLSSRLEPRWLTDLRRTAWKKFQELPMPHDQPPGPLQEEWRRTDIRRFRLEKFPLPGAGSREQGAGSDSIASGLSASGLPAPSSPLPAPTPLLTAGVDLAGTTSAVDSCPSGTRLDPDLAAKGVLFGSLDELVRQHGAVIEPYLLTRAVDPLYDKFSALHAACWSGGMILYVPRGVAIDLPLHMFSVLSAGQSDFGHALIVLEEGAEATVLAETASIGPTAAGLHCGAVEILVGPGARLRYVNLQNWGSGVWHFAHQKALVGRDASLQWTIGALGSRLAKVNQHVALVGEGAHAQVNGVMFTDGTQHLSYHTLQHHEVPHCTSDLLYKGALQGASRIVWRGMIKVDRDAQKTDGYQRDDNLILSESARADSIPGLEIEADDVKCSHGATAGRVDDEQVFYAQARGLTRKEAVRMIVAGFFQQVFDRITVESVREALGAAIGRRVREHD